MQLSVFALFVGAFLDALIGPNLVVPGEPFLLAAGYQLHHGIMGGVFAVLLGGLLGDQSSYWIGRKYGLTVQRKLIAWQPRFNRPLARCRLFMRQNGNKVLLFARLLGPIAWLVPFVAGTQQIAWQRFSFFATIGLIIGMGQFIFWGYLLAYGIDKIPWLYQLKALINDHPILLFTLIFSGLIGFSCYRYFQRKNKKAHRQ